MFRSLLLDLSLHPLLRNVGEDGLAELADQLRAEPATAARTAAPAQDAAEVEPVA
jgi:hypothetical protein